MKRYRHSVIARELPAVAQGSVQHSPAILVAEAAREQQWR
jgi:hypothetical protein